MNVETPCIVIELEKVQKNLKRMADICSVHRCKLRPHTKTHKMPEFAKLQIEYGASGITVAKLAEAETMAEHGIKDIFMAYPLIGEDRILRAIRLAKKIRLIVAVDCYESAKKISEVCEREEAVLEIRLETDTGMHRTGIPYEQAIEEAVRIAGLPGLSLQGIFTFRGMIYNGMMDTNLRKCGHQEGERMVALAEEIRKRGIPIQDVSVGSTPTAEFCAEVPGVTEVRPGTYIFQDMMQVNTAACFSVLEDVAATVWAQVVSTCKPGIAVIDCGCKSISTDAAQEKEPYHLQGFGTVIDHPELRFARLSEEHGMLEFDGDCTVKTGEILRIVPNHICPAINLYDQVYLMRKGVICEAYTVSARGKNY